MAFAWCVGSQAVRRYSRLAASGGRGRSLATPLRRRGRPLHATAAARALVGSIPPRHLRRLPSPGAGTNATLPAASTPSPSCSAPAPSTGRAAGRVPALPSPYAYLVPTWRAAASRAVAVRRRHAPPCRPRYTPPAVHAVVVAAAAAAAASHVRPRKLLPLALARVQRLARSTSSRRLSSSCSRSSGDEGADATRARSS